MWTIGNAECSPAKIHGVSTKSSWTPWRLMESPHGVFMESVGMWGSVKYSAQGQLRIMSSCPNLDIITFD